MAKRVVPSWSVIVLRIYGALHIVAGGYCLLRTEALFQGTLFLVRLAGALMILTGIVALLCKRWGKLSATATALALLLTCLLPFFSMPKEITLPGPMFCTEDYCLCIDRETEFPHLRTNISHSVLGLIVVLEWLAVAAYWRVWHVGKLKEWVKLARTWSATGRGRGKLRRANLRGTNLSGVDLGAAEEGGKGANLEAANLRASNLKGANLVSANLKGAHLQHADLQSANLKDANLEYTNLKGSNLEDANLQGATLSYASLRGAKLKGANLEGADLGGANLKRANLEGAKWSDATCWPKWFSPPSEAVKVDAEGNAH